MNALRRHRKSFASLATSLFVAVWASMALAPCLMAAEAIMDADCARCAEARAPCHDHGDQSDCDWVDGYDFDGRQPATPTLDLKLVALPAAAEPVLPPPSAAAFRPVTPRSPPNAAKPRLHLRNCVLND